MSATICRRCVAGDHQHQNFNDGSIAECPWQVIPGNVDVECDCPWRGDEAVMVLANDLPFTFGSTEDPLRALADTLATASNDWADSRAGAWIYGIVLGWDPDPEDLDDEDESSAMDQLALRFRWSDEQVARLRRLHAAFQQLSHGGAS